MKRYLLMGLGFSIAAGLMYFFVLGEGGALFYPFATLAFIGGPCIAGLFAVRGTPKGKISSCLVTSGSVLGIVLVLFFLMYGVVPALERTSVQLPAYCDGSYNSPLPAALVYEPGDNPGMGILVAEDAQTAVVAQVAATPPYSSKVYVVAKNDNRRVRTVDFPDDSIMAVVDSGIVYLYNDKFGYFFDARTGAFMNNIFTIDNYGGLSQSDRPLIMGASNGNWYVETSAVISSWGADGSVRSLPHLILNAVARGCFVNGKTGEVTKL